ncbi:unnamed protein product [Oppiella nova]|uniref:Uncharacterized protein n=1 Tax=Oppiella nova TaxID=334625 RepID=A0A7R9MHS7_9ACAR|nr:unnamed protein product [Oppiella nova]CAG2176450.1 unnamed protein product [Oppiella nova]
MVYGLGSNSAGQLGLGHNTPIHTPQRVPQLCHQNIHQFLSGEAFALAVNTDNNVIFSFGCNGWGQLGRHVNMDVNVFGWGSNMEGQVGCETNDNLNNSIFEKSFDVITKLGEGGYGQV